VGIWPKAYANYARTDLMEMCGGPKAKCWC